MKCLLIFCIISYSLPGKCQQVTSVSEHTIEAKKTVFSDQFGNNVTSEAFFKSGNSGLYNVWYSKTDSGVVYFHLDSTRLLKLLNKARPSVSYKDINGRDVLVPAIGKVTVLNFWFTTCIQCIEEMDSLNRLVKDIPGIEFIALTADSLSTVKNFLQKHDFNYTIIPGCADLISSFFVTAYPTQVVCDKTGKIRYIFVRKDPDLRTRIQRLID